MNVENFIELVGADFYTGVPDSQLKALCNFLMDKYGMDSRHHIIAANEGNAVALAAGYHMATGKIPVVYMQNSGEGNVINPVASLLNDKVYAIPAIFVIGWRGEPGIYDEPQHVFQGEITTKLLDDLGIIYYIIDKETTENNIKDIMDKFKQILLSGKIVAFVVRKGALSYSKDVVYKNNYNLSREEVIRHLVDVSGEDIIVSTTGKASRELFEIREKMGQGHKFDFLTVGSMGHTSSIALGIALQKTEKKVWCLDGDGSVLMHMGAMAVVGANAPQNMVHIVINNEAHETVGGMPTAIKNIDLSSVAKACGYEHVICADNYSDLDEALFSAKNNPGLYFIEVKCSIGSRSDLGRPTTTALENKIHFMEYLSECS